MDSDTSNYAMRLETQYDQSSDQVTVTVNSMYTGSLSSVSVFLYRRSLRRSVRIHMTME